MRNDFDRAIKILNSVFSDGTYGNVALSGGEKPGGLTTLLVYGVLEKNIRLEYILNSLIEKKPKPVICTLLKIGAYALLYTDNLPDYAIVSECVETAKMNGKGGVGGFVNAVLKKVASKAFKLPSVGDKDYLSVTYSKPQWFIEKLFKEYGEKISEEILTLPLYDKEHVRVNERLSSIEEVENTLKKTGVEFEESLAGGLIVRDRAEVERLFDKGIVTFQSPSSMLAVKALSPEDGSKILDLCSAPGGKAVYMAELCPSSVITACDVHEHRINLIQHYKQRMRTPNVKAALADASVFDPQWENAFDYVLLDAPCSCFGTFRKHPDVFLNKSPEDIKKLAALQRSIADNAVRYLKKGGVLVYSTCTLFKEENGEIADYIISKGLRPEHMPIPLENDGRVTILPHEEWDGFFIARFKK